MRRAFSSRKDACPKSHEPLVPEPHIPHGSVGNAQPKLHERWLPKPNPVPRSTLRARFNWAFEVWLDAGPRATQRLTLYTEADTLHRPNQSGRVLCGRVHLAGSIWCLQFPVETTRSPTTSRTASVVVMHGVSNTSNCPHFCALNP